MTIEEAILKYLTNRDLDKAGNPFATTDEIRADIIKEKVFHTEWDEKKERALIRQLQMLVDQNYIKEQAINCFRIAANGRIRYEEIIHPRIDLSIESIKEQKKSNNFAMIGVFLTIIAILISLFGTPIMIHSTKEAGSNVLYTKKDVIDLNSISDQNKQSIVATRLSDWFTETPSNLNVLGIPYSLANESLVYETESETSKNSNTILIPVSIKNPRKIHLLMNLSYGATIYTGNQPLKNVNICDVTFYTKNKKATYPLKAGVDIREWVIGSSKSITSVGDHVKTIWRSSHRESGLSAVVDDLTITLPIDWDGETLTKILIQDKSQEMLSSVDPGLILFGITIEHVEKQQ